MGYTAKDVLAIAQGEIGYLEKASNSNLDDKTANAGSANYTKYARDLYNAGYYNGNKNGYAWCDCFTDWVHFMASGKNKKLAEEVTCQTGDLGAACQYSSAYYKQQNRFSQEPKVGDAIFFCNSSRTRVEHTGIVSAVTDTYVYTIEGNTSGASGVIANGGGVFEKKYKRTYARIYGFGHPKYDGDETDPMPAPTPVPPSDEKSIMRVRVKAGALNVRKGAGVQYSTAGMLYNGDEVDIYEKKNNWGRMSKGWISLKYTTEIGSVDNSTPETTTPVSPGGSVKATGFAKKYDRSLAGTYTVSSSGLDIRHGAGANKALMVNIPKDTKVKCYGYYSTSGINKWLYVQFNYNGVTYSGFALSTYLKR